MTTEKLIERIDNYKRVMRYKYLQLEKLSRLETLQVYYDSKTVSQEILSSKLDFAEQLSGELKLPLKVRGVFLFEGRPLAKYYSKEELIKSVNNPVNSSFPLMLDHEDRKAAMIVGMVDKIEYDSKINGLRWRGHINDETHARNVLDGATKEVSATIFSTAEYNDRFGLMGINLTYKELSLVITGQVKGNFIEVDR